MADETTEVPDTGGTNPQASQSTQPGTTPSTTPTDSTQIDPSQATPDDTNSGTQGRGQTPTQTAQQFPFPGDQNGPQGARDLSKAVEATPDTTAPPAVTQAVQKATWTHQVIQALAGGPQTKTVINPTTGEVQRSTVPVSNARMGMSIALAALTGAFNGLAQKGPGAEGRAAAEGFDAALQQKKDQQQQQDEEASKTYARQAAIAQTNFTMHQTAQRMGELEYADHKEYVSDAATGLANIKAAGADLESGVPESDLLTKYNITKNNAIPDGVVARMDPATGTQAKDKYGQLLWDNTYTVIDPQKKIALDQDSAKFLADHHVPGYFTQDANGNTVPKDFSGSAQIKAGLYVNGLAQASAIKTTEAQLNSQISRLLPGDAGKVDGKVFEANLTKNLGNGTVTPKALQAFAPYASMPFDQALDAMRKAKVDPQLVGQVASLLPQDVQDNLKTATATQAALQKASDQREALSVNKNNYSQVLADPSSYSPTQVASAKSVRQLEISEASSKSFGEAYNRTQAEINAKKANGIPLTAEAGQGTDNLTHPELAKYLTDENYNTPDGRNDAFLNAMKATDPERAALVKAYADGRDIQSYYSAAKKFGGSIAADIHAYDPTFNTSDIHQYEKTILAMGPSGPIGKANKSASTTFVHLNNLTNSLGVLSTVGLSGEAKENAANAISEMSNAYANGNKPGENEIQDQRRALGSSNPLIAKAAVKTAAHDLLEKVRADHAALAASLPRGIKVPGYIDAAGANAFNKITGEPVDVNLIVAPSGATSTVPDKKTGKLYYVSAHNQVLGEVPGQGK